MQERATIARPYARAAFEQARADGRLREWSDWLRLLAMIVADAQMRRAISTPKLDAAQLTGLLADISGATLPPNGRNFLAQLVGKRRLGVVAQIFGQFERKRAAAEGVAEVEVQSAFELDERQQAAIRELMKKRLGRDVKLSAAVNPELIGGAVIRAGDSVIDVSLRGRLRQLANQFAG
jgi:F-type H+-transporting ATPase subunit delta